MAGGPRRMIAQMPGVAVGDPLGEPWAVLTDGETTPQTFAEVKILGPSTLYQSPELGVNCAFTNAPLLVRRA